MTSLNIDASSFSALSGKVAVVTGGSSGIGLATSLLFASHGAKVVVADLNPPTEHVPSSIFAKCDVTSWPTILSTFDTAVKHFGRVDILIANAGIGESEDIFQDDYDADGKLKEPKWLTLDIDIGGVLNCVKVAVSQFRKQGGGGRIVMTASTAGYMSEPGVPVYSAAKHAVIGFMRASKRQLSKWNISINSVAPWMTDTPLIFPSLRKVLKEANIPVQPTSAVAVAMAHSACAPDWTGKTVYAAGGRYTELEEPILTLESQWLGIENSKLWRVGQELDYLTATKYSMSQYGDKGES